MSLTDYQINTINKILSIPSVGGQETTNAPYGELPKLALDTFLEEAKNNGFRTGIIDNKVGWIEIGRGDKLIGIVCHLDVVPAGDGWNTDPFVPTYKDGKIYARGIVDDKGPALISYFAMKSILDNNIPVNSRIRLILGSDEERTCDCVETYAVKGEIPSFAFTPDAEFPVVFAEKGILQLKISGKGTSAITVKGGSAANMVPSLSEACFDQKQIIANGKAAHASKPHLGVNAIDNLVKDLASNGLAGAAELLSFMDKCIVNNTSEQITGCSIIDESGSITTNEGIIRINDDEQYLVIDIRYPISASKDDIVNTISNKASEFNLEVTVNGHMNPLYKDKNSSEIDILTSIWKRHIKNYDGFENGYESNPEYTSPVAMGGGTYARHMPNTIAFGIQAPWAIDQCHQANECMSINDFEESIEVVKEAIIELSNN